MNAKDDEALGRVIRTQTPRAWMVIRQFGPVAALFYALGGGSGTILTRINHPAVTSDTIRAILAPIRESVSVNADNIRRHDVAIREMKAEQGDVRVVVDAHTRYLIAQINPWNGPYRGPR